MHLARLAAANAATPTHHEGHMTVTQLKLSDRNAAEMKHDALVLASVQKAGGAALAPGHRLGDETVAHLEAGLLTLKAKGGADEVVKLVAVPGVAATLVLVAGAGKVAGEGAPLDPEAVRRAVGSATRQLSGVSTAVVVAPGTSLAEAIAAAEGAIFGAFAVATAAAGPASASVKSLTLASPLARDRGLRAGVKRAVALGTATNYTRDLVNQAPSDLYPASFAAPARKRAIGIGVTFPVLAAGGLAPGAFGGPVRRQPRAGVGRWMVAGRGFELGQETQRLGSMRLSLQQASEFLLGAVVLTALRQFTCDRAGGLRQLVR